MSGDGWIDINERKPAEGETVLTLMKHGQISGRWDDRMKFFTEYYWTDMTWMATHWRPLLDPPNKNNNKAGTT